jgi:hypothetical protein
MKPLTIDSIQVGKEYRIRMDAKKIGNKYGPRWNSSGKMDYLLGKIVTFKSYDIHKDRVYIDHWTIGINCLEEIEQEPELINTDYLIKKEKFLQLLKEKSENPKQQSNCSC